jgi:hypothetical protein
MIFLVGTQRKARLHDIGSSTGQGSFCMKRLAPLAFVILLLSSCAATPKAKGIEEADSRMVANCIFLGSVNAASMWGGCLCQGVGFSSAKNQALNKAAKLGATHIVWLNLESGLGGGFASGRAYRCAD